MKGISLGIFNCIMFSPEHLSCRKVFSELADHEGLWLAVRSGIHRAAETSHCTQRLRMLHELRGERQSQASCNVVSKSHQFEHQYQLLHLQHVWGLLHVDPASGAQRRGRVQRHSGELTGTGRVLHHAQCQRWAREKRAGLLVSVVYETLTHISFTPHTE